MRPAERADTVVWPGEAAGRPGDAVVRPGEAVGRGRP